MSQGDEQGEYNVHYGTNSTSNNMVHKSKQKVANQPNQKHQTPIPNKIKILARDQFVWAFLIRSLLEVKFQNTSLALFRPQSKFMPYKNIFSSQVDVDATAPHHKSPLGHTHSAQSTLCKMAMGISDTPVPAV